MSNRDAADNDYDKNDDDIDDIHLPEYTNPLEFEIDSYYSIPEN